MSALGWCAVLSAWFVFGGLAYVIELLRRELRAMRGELHDWRATRE